MRRLFAGILLALASAMAAHASSPGPHTHGLPGASVPRRPLKQYTINQARGQVQDNASPRRFVPAPGGVCTKSGADRACSCQNFTCWTAAAGCHGRCGPGHERCGPEPYPHGRLSYHIQDLTCASSDTNFPFYDRVHHVYHIFYQDVVGGKNATGKYHVAIGHVVSRDFVHWAQMPVALWPDQPYDSLSLFTGSATVVEGRPFLVYPGWPMPGSYPSTVFAMAVPADGTDPLYTNWTKQHGPGIEIATNPIVNHTSDDPSSAWRTEHGEWRFLSNGGPNRNSSLAPIYGASNFTGRWRYVGDSNLLAGECGSLFRLPPLYAGTVSVPGMPTHVHKRGCGNGEHAGNCPDANVRQDYMTLGNWTDGDTVDDPGSWTAASPERKVDNGAIYAGKDFWDSANDRRIFLAWARFGASSQTLARLEQLVFSPAPEYAKLHGPVIARLGPIMLRPKARLALGIPTAADALTADFNMSFGRPSQDAIFGVNMLNNLTIYVDYSAKEAKARVGMYRGPEQYPTPPPGGAQNTTLMNDSLKLLPSDEFITIRVFTDANAVEVFWMDGRVAMTWGFKGVQVDGQVNLFCSAECVLASAVAWTMGSIWVSPDHVRATPPTVRSRERVHAHRDLVDGTP